MATETDNAQSSTAIADATDHAPTATPDTGAPASETPAEGHRAGAARSSIRDAVSKALNEASDDATAAAPVAVEGDDATAQDDAAADPAAADDGAQQQDDEADGADPDFAPPKGISADANKRFGRLVQRIKESDARYTELHGKFSGIEQTLRSTGATPQQWGQVLTAMRYANSGDPQQARQALEILDSYRAEVARVAGVPVQGVDVLGEFPDLRAKVERGDLDEESAAELAANRRAMQRNRTQASDQQQREQASAQLQQRQTTARSSLDALGAKLAKADVDYPRKVEILEKRGVIARIVSREAPEEWMNSFQEAYDALGDVASTARVPAQSANEQPMRRTGKTASGTQAHPNSVRDAVRMALNE